jgi:patatin-like phospholipase/acyl hydrolase
MLDGLRIWLSGSIPEHATEEDAEQVRRFVGAFAAEVFRRGGRLVHGSHPSIRDELLEAAGAYKVETGRKAGLVLVVSRHFSKDPKPNGIDVDAWNQVCAEPVIETREALERPAEAAAAPAMEPGDPRAFDEAFAAAQGAPRPRADAVSRDECLAILRDALVEQSSAIVAMGGKWWAVAAARAGVPEEVELACKKHLPLFLLGALGGSLRAYLDGHPELLRDCRNGLTEDQNRELAALADPDELARRICDQLSRLPLSRKSANRARPFRVLCLDGGGIRGVFTAAVLRRWEEMTERKVVEHFDLIAGTSTGGILAIGLGLGMSPAEMERFYVSRGTTIFPVEEPIRSLACSLRHWFASKFDRTVLEKAVVEAYEGAPVKMPGGRYRTRLLITAYNSTADLPYLFRAWLDPEYPPPYRTFDPVPAALATSAAPTYFDPNQIQHVRAIDGGVWANSPTTITLAEAVQGLGVEPERIEMLSVGTTFDTLLLGQPAQLDGKMIEMLAKPVAGGVAAKLAGMLWKPTRIEGKLGWLPNIAGFLMKTQAQTADYVCKRVLGDRFVRVDVPTVPTSLDDTAAIDLLISLGENAAEERLADVRTRFLNGVPIRAGAP